VGTCSWADKTMVKTWYPAGVTSAADRLRYYASLFDTVEVDSSFYAIPTRVNSRLWAERTPPGFVFHIKAFGMLTRHGVRPAQLPPILRGHEDLELDHSGRVVHPSRDFRRRAFTLFSEALQPLRDEGKLGLILMQFPPYFVAGETNREYIRWSAGLLSPDRVAVEFRHASWVRSDELERTLELLRSLGLTYVCVDAPVSVGTNVLPPITVATSEIAYVRFHGRNAATWNARVATAAERFRYLYSCEELAGWVEPVRHLQAETATTYLMFNNCYADYAPRNARQMMSLINPPRE